MAEEEETDTEEEGGKKKSKLMLFIIIGVVLLLGGGGGAFFLLGGSGDEGKDGEHDGAEEEVVNYQHYELDNIIVNLSENTSFLKVKLLIEYDPNLVFPHDAHGGGGAYGGGGAGGGGDAPAGPPGVLGERAPMIQDSIIHVLSSKKASEVLTPEGKEILKEELVEAINEATGLDEGPVVAVYFLEFIIQ